MLCETFVAVQASNVGRWEAEQMTRQEAYSVVLDAMKYVSVVSGPAMDAKEYRAFMDAMKIFSIAASEILANVQ
jgi:hypothetical protein